MQVFWDEPKRKTNLKEHGLDFADARDRFEWETALITESYPDGSGKARFAATGILDADLVTLIFSVLGSEAISTISLRPASRKERRTYAQK